MVRGTFSPARAWRPTVGPASTQTLGFARSTLRQTNRLRECKCQCPREAFSQRGHVPLRRRRPPCFTVHGRVPPSVSRCLSPRQTQVWYAVCSPQPLEARAVSRSSPSSDAQCALVPASSVRATLPPMQSANAQPNPSLKLSPNGGPRGPGRRYAVHFRQPGPRVPPLVPA